MQKIQASMILEILGRPKEYIVEALNNLITRLSKESGVKINYQTIHEPLPVKDSKDLYTTFADLNIEFDSLQQYYSVLFAYMPANVEIIRPESLSISNSELTVVGNRLIQKLHDYDAIAKKMISDRQILLDQLRQHAPQVFKKDAPNNSLSKVDEKPLNNSNEKKSKKKSKKGN